jgi:DNA-binding LacI/PurR family transcriptional regulator
MVLRGNPRPPTLEDVAARAGVGRGTASRALNGSNQVSDSTRAAVLRAVEDLGYVPNQAARSLVTRTTDSVALVVSEPGERFFAEPFFAAVVRSAGAALAAQGRQLVVSFVQDETDHQRLRRFLTPQHVDGVLLLSSRDDDPLPAYLEGVGLPTVAAGRRPADSGTAWVDVDNAGGARAAVAHLVAAGRRRIGLVAGPSDLAAGRDRREGWADGLDAAGLDPDERLVAAGDFGEASGAAAADELLDRVPDLDAIFACSDPMAVGTLTRLSARGVRVPDDVAVVGFDDAPGSAFTAPPLTTVHQPLAELGQELVRMLAARIAGLPVQPTVLPTRLVVRASG